MHGVTQKARELKEAFLWLIGYPYTFRYIFRYSYSALGALGAYHIAGAITEGVFVQQNVQLCVSLAVAFLMILPLYRMYGMGHVPAILVSLGIVGAVLSWEIIDRMGWDRDSMAPHALLLALFSVLSYGPLMRDAEPRRPAP